MWGWLCYRFSSLVGHKECKSFQRGSSRLGIGDKWCYRSRRCSPTLWFGIVRRRWCLCSGNTRLSSRCRLRCWSTGSSLEEWGNRGDRWRYAGSIRWSSTGRQWRSCRACSPRGKLKWSTTDSYWWHSRSTPADNSDTLLSSHRANRLEVYRHRAGKLLLIANSHRRS